MWISGCMGFNVDFRLHVTEGILITKTERPMFVFQTEAEGKLSEVESYTEHSLFPEI